MVIDSTDAFFPPSTKLDDLSNAEDLLLFDNYFIKKKRLDEGVSKEPS